MKKGNDRSGSPERSKKHPDCMQLVVIRRLAAVDVKPANAKPAMQNTDSLSV